MQTFKVGISKLIIAIGALFFLGASIFAYLNTFSTFKSYLTASLFIGVSIFGTLLIAYLLKNKWFTRNRFFLLLIVLAVGLRLAWVLKIDTPPVSDFLDMHSAALSAARGDFTFGQSEYFTRWVYQLGFTMYEAGIIKLFGEPIRILQLFNIAFNVGTAVIVYLAASRLFNEFCGKMASLLYAVYVPHIIMCSVLTNQHLSTFLYTLGCYLLIRTGVERLPIRSGVAIGICFALGNFVRPMGSFFLIGLAVYLLWFQFRKENVLPILKKGVAVFAVYFILTQAASYLLIATGITNYTLANREPYWKFMVGFNPATTGGWSWEDTEYVTKFPIGEERNEAELALLKQRLENKAEVIQLMKKKFILMWGSEDTAPQWSLYGMERWDLVRILTKAERVEYVLVMLFGFIGMLLLLRSVEKPGPTWMLVLVLGYAVLHLVIEIQTRYRFDILPFVFILQSYGVFHMFSLKKSSSVVQ